MSFPSKITLPPSAFRRPARTSANSCCPLPEIPAMPKISPSRIENETPFKARKPLSLRAERFSTWSMGFPFSTFVLSILKMTSLPTIFLARLFSVARPVSKRAVTFPRLRTVTLSLMASTMGSLWVMNGMMASSSLAMASMDAKSFFVSGGVSAEVGSSKMRTLAPR